MTTRASARSAELLQDDSTVTLTPLEPDDEDNVEFPFPEDELEAGQALLQVKRGPNAGSTFLLDADLTSVGRGTDSDVFLDDVTVSRKHAMFERRDRASGSSATPGPERDVRERRAGRRDEARHGDQVQIGRFKLTFFLAGE